MYLKNNYSTSPCKLLLYHILVIGFLLTLTACGARPGNSPINTLSYPKKINPQINENTITRVGIKAEFAPGTKVSHLKRADKIARQLTEHLNQSSTSDLEFIPLSHMSDNKDQSYDYLINLSCKQPNTVTDKNELLFSICWPATVSLLASPIGLIGLSVPGIVKEKTTFDWRVTLSPKNYDGFILKKRNISKIDSSVYATGWGVPEEVQQEAYSYADTHLYKKSLEFVADIDWAKMKQRVASYISDKSRTQEVSKKQKKAKNYKKEAPLQQAVNTKELPKGFSKITEKIESNLPKAEQKNKDGVALIIGNKNYSNQNKDVPNVKYAYNDAKLMKKFAIKTLGFQKGNVIVLKDASKGKLESWLGSEKYEKGRLADLVKNDNSELFIYYSGHGIPAIDDGRSYLLPVDGNPSQVRITGYPLERLYNNLAKIPAKKKIVAIDACFSGVSNAGMLIENASPAMFRSKIKKPELKKSFIITAASSNEIASWDQKARLGLFTKYMLKGVSGAADSQKYGRKNGKVSTAELKAFLKDKIPYQARKIYGRNQHPQVLSSTENIIISQTD